MSDTSTTIYTSFPCIHSFYDDILEPLICPQVSGIV